MLKNRPEISPSKRICNGFAAEPLRNSIRDELKFPLSSTFAKHIEHLAPVEAVPGNRIERDFFDLCGNQLPGSPASRFPRPDHSHPIVTDSFKGSAFNQQRKEELAQEINLRERRTAVRPQKIGIEQALETLYQQFNLPAHTIQLKDHFGRQFTGRNAGQDKQPVAQQQSISSERVALLLGAAFDATARLVRLLLAQAVCVQVSLAGLPRLRVVDEDLETQTHNLTYPLQS